MVTTLKITSIGNSLGMILPKEALAHFNLDKGDKMHLSLAPDGFHLALYDEDLQEELRLGREIMRRDRDVLRLLAQ